MIRIENKEVYSLYIYTYIYIYVYIYTIIHILRLRDLDSVLRTLPPEGTTRGKYLPGTRTKIPAKLWNLGSWFQECTSAF